MFAAALPGGLSTYLAGGGSTHDCLLWKVRLGSVGDSLRIDECCIRMSCIVSALGQAEEDGLGFVGRFPVVTRNSTASHSDTGSFSWPESAGLALPRDQHGLGPISEPRPQLGVGNVERVGHVTGRVLPYRAYVQDRHVLGQLVRASQHELTGHHVVGDHAGLVDGILGLSVGRRVGEIQVNEVSRAQAGPHGGSDGIDAPVHAVGAHVHEDMHRLSAGEIAHVLVRVRVHREVPPCPRRRGPRQ